MKILHITAHLGGGLGTVILDWIKHDTGNDHTIISLDTINDKAYNFCREHNIRMFQTNKDLWFINNLIENNDIILVHWYDHPFLLDLFKNKLPDSRLIFWCHKNYDVSDEVVQFPDMFVDTSPIQGNGLHIWSTGDMSRFREIKPKKHEGFNIGYIGTVDYKKLHLRFFNMCKAICVRDVRFTVVGENNIGESEDDRITFTGKVDDIAPYLAEMDILGYPLHRNHYGTCEQVLGEAMSAGVVPFVLNNPAESKIVVRIQSGFIAVNPREYVAMINNYVVHASSAIRSLMSLNAKIDARLMYNIDHMNKQWGQKFDMMMQHPKRQRRSL